MSSMRSSWSMRTLFYHEKMWSPMSHWHGKGNRNDARRTGVTSKCSVFQVLNEVLENLSKINLHLADMSLIWSPGLWKTQTNSQCDGLTHRLSFCLGLTGCRGSDFPPSVLFQQLHRELCDSDKGYNYIHFEMHLQIFPALVQLAWNTDSPLGARLLLLSPFNVSNDYRQNYQKQ